MTSSDLPPIVVPPPRRTDAAFARSVKDGVAARKSRTLFVFPAFAAAAAAFALVVVVRGPDPVTKADAGVLVAIAPTGPARAAPTTPTAPSYFDDDDDADDFALPSLDGSSDEELARLDRALDIALQGRTK